MDANGDPTWAANATCAARVERKYRRNKTQRDVEWESKYACATETDLPMGTRVWPPGFATGDVNAALEVIEAIAATSPLSGDTLYELVL